MLVNTAHEVDFNIFSNNSHDYQSKVILDTVVGLDDSGSPGFC